MSSQDPGFLPQNTGMQNIPLMGMQPIQPGIKFQSLPHENVSNSLGNQEIVYEDMQNLSINQGVPHENAHNISNNQGIFQNLNHQSGFMPPRSGLTQNNFPPSSNINSFNNMKPPNMSQSGPFPQNVPPQLRPQPQMGPPSSINFGPPPPLGNQPPPRFSALSQDPFDLLPPGPNIKSRMEAPIPVYQQGNVSLDNGSLTTISSMSNMPLIDLQSGTNTPPHGNFHKAHGFPEGNLQNLPINQRVPPGNMVNFSNEHGHESSHNISQNQGGNALQNSIQQPRFMTPRPGMPLEQNHEGPHDKTHNMTNIPGSAPQNSNHQSRIMPPRAGMLPQDHNQRMQTDSVHNQGIPPLNTTSQSRFMPSRSGMPQDNFPPPQTDVNSFNNANRQMMPLMGLPSQNMPSQFRPPPQMAPPSSNNFIPPPPLGNQPHPQFPNQPPSQFEPPSHDPFTMPPPGPNTKQGINAPVPVYPPGIPSIQLRSHAPGPPIPGPAIQMGLGMDGAGYNEGYVGQPPRMGAPADPGAAMNYPGRVVGYRPQQPMPQQPMVQQPQGSRKLNPDLIPSVIQVIEFDQKNYSGIFKTGQRGSVPPLVTTDFVTEDLGTCSPRFLRSTMYSVPCNADMMKSSHLPFVVALTPFASLQADEIKPPLVDFGPSGPIRCNRCKAYMCPFMMFVDGGRKFQCCFCMCSTEVPADYFAHLDHTGRRIDCYQRSELSLGSYEFVATVDYCKDSKLPNEPAFIFMIDVSYSAVRCGLVDLLCTRLKNDILKYLPKEEGASESEIRVGFVTYAKDIHFYNIKNNLVQPQMMIVTDVNDMFVPLVDGFLVKFSECETVIDSLLIQISEMFVDTQEREILLGPVIEAGLDALKSAQRSGKLIIFSTSLPTVDAPGRLKARDDRSLLGTDKEKTLLAPLNNYYTKLGQDCVAAGCSVDIFLFPNSYIDVASVAEVPRLTGGSLFKYSYFQADTDADTLINDLRINISQEIGFDAVLRLRTSTGIRAVDFFGNIYMSNTTDVELAAVNSKKKKVPTATLR